MNEIYRNKDQCELIIRRRNGEKFIVIFSFQDYEKIQKHRWCMFITKRQIYVRSPKGIFIHHAILPKKHGLFVDHVNGNTLDNRRNNLRYASRYQNGWNMKKRKDNTSGTKGITWFKKTQKWNVRISYKGKRFCLGHYSNIKDAINKRSWAEEHYFKEFKYETRSKI